MLSNVLVNLSQIIWFFDKSSNFSHFDLKFRFLLQIPIEDFQKPGGGRYLGKLNNETQIFDPPKIDQKSVQNGPKVLEKGLGKIFCTYPTHSWRKNSISEKNFFCAPQVRIASMGRRKISMLCFSQYIDAEWSKIGWGLPNEFIWGLRTLGCMLSVDFWRPGLKTQISRLSNTCEFGGSKFLTTQLCQKNSAESRIESRTGLSRQRELFGYLGPPP